MSKNDEIATLRAQLIEAQNALKSAQKVTETQFRTESTRAANNFHVAYNQLFAADFVRETFADFFVRHEDETNCDVYAVELKDALKAYLLKKLE
jgi:hypothetical protein